MACFDGHQIHLALLPGSPQMFTVTKSKVLVLVVSAVTVLVLAGVAESNKRSDVHTDACSLARRCRPEFQVCNLDDETHSPEFACVSRADGQSIPWFFSQFETTGDNGTIRWFFTIRYIMYYNRLIRRDCRSHLNLLHARNQGAGGASKIARCWLSCKPPTCWMFSVCV